jgi:hypothetical protein
MILILELLLFYNNSNKATFSANQRIVYERGWLGKVTFFSSFMYLSEAITF